MFTVDRFLGINEAADGYTEVNMGEASAMKNFLITDACNLTVRPGIRRVDFEMVREPAQILTVWSGQIGEDSGSEEDEYLVVVDFHEGVDRFWMYTMADGDWTVCFRQDGALGLTAAEGAVVKVFAFGSRLYVMSTAKTCVLQDGILKEAEPYIPRVIAGMDPAGGGTTIENINLLTSKRRVDFSADGEATAFVLPSEATAVVSVTVDNTKYPPEELGSFDPEKSTYTFAAAPVKGVGNVEFTYDTDAAATEPTRQKLLRMPLIEAYNGSTDTRLFVAGDGSNICYYTGVTETGVASPLYFPAMNEVKVDVTGAAVTGLTRHYSKLLAFTREGAYTISYEPVTQTDGSTIAGFYLRTMNREFGNDAVGQVRTVNNYPRTITKDGIYEWRITSSYYKDERYAKRVSDKVKRSLQGADMNKIVACDDTYAKTYYVFLNDSDGTILVNRYDIGKEGVWCIYNSHLCTNVRQAVMCRGVMVFSDGQEVFYFDEHMTKDAPADPAGETVAIPALWESGYMDFGADFQRKYSSQIYVSLLPQTNSTLIITAATDKRAEYMEKSITTNLFSFENFGFPWLTFDANATPRIQRVRLKVKKFVYYKLIFKVEAPGARATVLGYDQTVRYASMAK